jgi:hypothetical protein
LLLPDSFLQNFHHSGQDDLAEYFAGNTEKVDAPPIFTVSQVAFLGYLYDNSSFPLVRDGFGCPNVSEKRQQSICGDVQVSFQNFRG